MEKYVVNKKIQITFLSDYIVRVEFNENGEFCNENTFLFPNLKSYSAEGIEIKRGKDGFYFNGYEILLSENAENVESLKVLLNRKTVYKYKRLKNSGELPEIGETPEIFSIFENERILVPPCGYSTRSDTDGAEYRIEKNVNVFYLLFCKKDAKLLRRLYVELTGRNQMVRLSTLGCWNSKYFEYNEETAKQLINDYIRHDVPLDNMVLDTDWRISTQNGIGYEINENLFPDFKGFVDFAHRNGVKITLNDHPEPLQGALSVFDKKEIAYREEKLTDLLKKNVDAWWYDRNWTTSLISPMDEIPCETLGMYLYENVTENYYKSVNPQKPIRPIIMGNVSDIAHSKYNGIKDSASHRYSIQWTGDIKSTDFASEIENLVRCGNNCVPYMNSDCGGHLDNPDKNTYIRWVQFCVFSPVFRPHCQKSVERYREPWVYDTETLDIVRAYIKLRYRLLPVIYNLCHENYETGLPICRSLGLVFDNDKRAQKENKQFVLGDNLLISPIYEKNNGENCLHKTYLPEGQWLDIFDGKQYEGKTTIKKRYALKATPLFIKTGSVIVLTQHAQNTESQSMQNVSYNLYPSRDCDYSSCLYEDDTKTVGYKNGEYRKTAFRFRWDNFAKTYEFFIDKSEGVFDGCDSFSERNAIVKFYLLNEKVGEVFINGEKVEKTNLKKTSDVLAFDTEENDLETFSFSFKQDVRESYRIVFHLI